MSRLVFLLSIVFGGMGGGMYLEHIQKKSNPKPTVMKVKQKLHTRDHHYEVVVMGDGDDQLGYLLHVGPKGVTLTKETD